MQIQGYSVVSSRMNHDSECIVEFMKDVNAMIDDGYEPVGGIAIRIGTQSGAYFVQSMIKRYKEIV
jgi:hypothetical protein